ncbi:hypothetical protein QC761_0102890 [Podospora bellae-mahoneyi]|uniref:Uncharacterized protein n=1 Tax=Podospora bellae-mahoneyi TaxID=2093777 RepID=A0ABR0F5Q2_9PEZI|nr:hypothetical protein QC761_0102890 [Podospora bellae-mahoneyi]
MSETALTYDATMFSSPLTATSRPPVQTPSVSAGNLLRETSSPKCDWIFLPQPVYIVKHEALEGFTRLDERLAKSREMTTKPEDAVESVPVKDFGVHQGQGNKGLGECYCWLGTPKRTPGALGRKPSELKKPQAGHGGYQQEYLWLPAVVVPEWKRLDGDMTVEHRMQKNHEEPKGIDSFLTVRVEDDADTTQPSCEVENGQRRDTPTSHPVFGHS